MAKERTVKQEQKYHKRWSLACFIAEFPVVFAPFITIGIVNYDKYFIQYDGTKVSISFILAMAVLGIAIYCVSKKKLENSMVTLLIGWMVTAFIFTILGELITDIAMIMWFGLIGLAGAFGLDKVSKAEALKAEKCKSAINKAEEDIMVEKHKKESAGDILG